MDWRLDNVRVWCGVYMCVCVWCWEYVLCVVTMRDVGAICALCI